MTVTSGPAVRSLLVAFLLAPALGACARVPLLSRAAGVFSEPDTTLEAAKRRARESVPEDPRTAEPAGPRGAQLQHDALRARGLRILVSTNDKALWLMRDSVPVLRAPIAIGKQEDFVFRGRRYDFDTPIGRRKVLGKALNPLWTPPDWHYFEIAAERGLEPVQLKANRPVRLTDSTTIVVRGDQVGRVNRYGNFWPFEPGAEIIFDGRIFIPPMNTAQRRVPHVLGGHKLEMGDGYLIHGTDQETSIGGAVSHGCVRMYNDDVARLYALVPNGTPVYIF